MSKKEVHFKDIIYKIIHKKNLTNKQVLEVSTGKPRQEEEKFYEHFSTVQMNAVLLLILSATFLTTGLTKYAEIIGEIDIVNRWLILIIFSIILFVVSIISITLGGVLVSLKDKRIANTAGFSSFLFGASVFFVSLVILMFYLF